MTARKIDEAYIKGRFELTDEQLEDIAGGVFSSAISKFGGPSASKRCACGTAMVLLKDAQGFIYGCPNCGQEQRVVAT